MYICFKKIDNTDHISAWKSKGLSDESIKPPSTSDNSFAPSLSYTGTITRMTFVGSSLKQDKITFTHKNIININIVYEINLWDRGCDYPTLENYSFGSLKLVKNAHINKYKYSGYGIVFDRNGTFSVGNLVKIDDLVKM